MFDDGGEVQAKKEGIQLKGILNIFIMNHLLTGLTLLFLKEKKMC